ncbi:TolC family protein [Polaribacter sejongensis]|uniref:TolC family protein n=1 Tax=Polaribacter sejongensis TaxID=985043 RepID=UPI0035A5F66C
MPYSDSVLEVELLKIKQQFIAIESQKTTLIETLSSLIGQSVSNATKFEKPLVKTELQTEISRPELDLFQLKKEEINSQEALISKQNALKLNGFATGGYGNPGLNMLDNSFQTYYIVGVKLHWNVFDWNTNKKQQATVAINKDIIENETEIFKLNTNIELNKQQQEIEKISAFINSDEEIINLRKKVLKTLDAQLKNGVITSSVYITEFTNLFEAENTLLRHKIQVQLAKANYNTIKGQ